MIVKEVLQLRRDRLTFAMMFGMPIMQLVLFGYAINADPKGLPTAVLVAEHTRCRAASSPPSATPATSPITPKRPTEAEADELLQRGDVQFVITIPADFTRKLIRGEKPADRGRGRCDRSRRPRARHRRRDPGRDPDPGPRASGPLAQHRQDAGPVDVVLHRRYNPEGITRYNIVPGLLGIILTMTMVMMTALAVTRERERGTMENLLAMPVRPIEVMAGKIAPYIVIGCVQVAVILAAARLLFGVPFVGSFALFATGHAAVHHGQSRDRLHLLDHGAEPAAGHADVVLLPHAVDPAVGLRVPVPRHAGLGAGDRRSAAGHPFPPDRPWTDAEGSAPRRSFGGNLPSSA